MFNNFYSVSSFNAVSVKKFISLFAQIKQVKKHNNVLKVKDVHGTSSIYTLKIIAETIKWRYPKLLWAAPASAR